MKAFEITLTVNTGPYKFVEFTGRFTLGSENYLRGIVEDNNGEQSYLYGYYECNHLVCVNIRNIKANPEKFYFNFSDVTRPGFCYFTSDDFTSTKRKDLRKTPVFVFIKPITENSDSVAKDVENRFIHEMQYYASTELLTSLYITIERAKPIFF